jgi:hypothetical protein
MSPFEGGVDPAKLYGAAEGLARGTGAARFEPDARQREHGGKPRFPRPSTDLLRFWHSRSRNFNARQVVP